MPLTERRERLRRKRRYGPKLTNPGLRIVQRELAVKAKLAIPCDDCGGLNDTHDLDVEH